MKTAKMLRAAIGTLLSLGLLSYIGYGLWQNWGKIRFFPWDVRPGLLFLSGCLLFLGYFIFFLLWKFLLQALGENVSPSFGFRIWFLSQLGKYIPGKIWGAIGRVFLMQKAGIGFTAGSLSVVYELVLLILSGLIFSLLTIPFWGSGGRISIAYGSLTSGYTIASCIILLLAFLHPKVLSRLGRFIPRYMEGPSPGLKGAKTIGYRSLLGFLLLYVLLWGLIGFSFYLFIASLTSGISLMMIPALSGIFVFSWVASSLVFLAPGGLGIREGLIFLAIGHMISPEFAVVSALGSRIWTTLVEMIGVGIGAALVGQRR